MARCAVQAGQDDGIEFQALGFVHGHDLDHLCFAGRIGNGRRVEQCDLLVQAIQREAGAAVDLIQQAPICLGIGTFGSVMQARFATEHAPHGLDPAPCTQAALMRQRLGKHGTHMTQPSLTIGRQRCHTHRVVHQLPYCALMIIRSQRVQVGQYQPAPRRTQYGQPVQSISAVMQGAGQ